MEVQDHLCSTCYIVQLITHIQLIQNKSLHQEEGSNNFVVNVLCISRMREGKWSLPICLKSMKGALKEPLEELVIFPLECGARERPKNNPEQYTGSILRRQRE